MSRFSTWLRNRAKNAGDERGLLMGNHLNGTHMLDLSKLKEDKELTAVVERLCKARNQPIPGLIRVSEKAEIGGTFYSAISPKNRGIVITRGTMDLKDKNERDAIIAHELGHGRGAFRIALQNVFMYTALLVRGPKSALRTLSRWLSRREESRADQHGGKMVSKEASAKALLRTQTDDELKHDLHGTQSQKLSWSQKLRLTHRPIKVRVEDLVGRKKAQEHRRDMLVERNAAKTPQTAPVASAVEPERVPAADGGYTSVENSTPTPAAAGARTRATTTLTPEAITSGSLPPAPPDPTAPPARETVMARGGFSLDR